jgi:cytochrome c oxidase subunit 4
MTGTSHSSHVKSYLTVYVSLLVLVIVTVAAAHVKTGSWAFPIAMAIAVTKMVLIVAIFMHAKDEFPLIRVVATAGVFWLGILLTFLMSDYITRHDVVPAHLPIDGSAAVYERI